MFLIALVFHPRVRVRYLNACNVIDQHNKIQKYDLALEKYWVKHSGCFRLATTVTLSVGTTDAKLLFWHGVSEQIRDNKIIMREYNSSTVYDCFNNPFPFYCGIQALNLSPVPIYDSPHPNKRARYTAAIACLGEVNFLAINRQPQHTLGLFSSYWRSLLHHVLPSTPTLTQLMCMSTIIDSQN